MSMQLKRRSLIKLNLRLFADAQFLRNAAFTNVTSGQQFYDGSIISRLVPDNSAQDELFGIEPNQVWQSFTRSWVYESGMLYAGTDAANEPPRLYSGVYIHGTLRRPNDPIYGHTPDFLNGRIIFNTPQSPNLDVHADFSFKHIRIGFENQFNQQFQNGVLEEQYITNPLTSMQAIYPSGRMQPFPAIFIEVAGRSHEGYELGNRSTITTDTVLFHIWALDDLQRDDIVDILDEQIRKSIPMIDFNKMPLPLSGMYNTLSPEYIPYTELLKNNNTVTTVGSGIPITNILHIKSSMPKNQEAATTYERSTVEWEVEIYPIGPNTPISDTGFQ